MLAKSDASRKKRSSTPSEVMSIETVPRAVLMYISQILRVKNGNDGINIRGAVDMQSPAELRQFNNGTCLIIHPIENNP